MNNPAFSVVRRTRTDIEAERIISALRDAGLHPLDLNTTSHFSFAAVDLSFHIEVPTNELAAAQEILRAVDESVGAG